MSPLLSSLLAAAVIGAVPFLALGSLSLAKKKLAALLKPIVAFAAGGLLGGAFLHLLPEAAETGGPVFEMTLVGILLFFVLDSLLWIYHCHGGHQLHTDKDHHGSCPKKPVGVLNLIGDAFHNLTDGIVVASAFLAGGPALGVPTAIAVALHEIPQEVGDFGILIYSGFSYGKALFWNLMVGLAMFAGVFIVFIAQDYVHNLTRYTIPFAAGGFIYMACTNLLSEIKEEESLKTRFIQFLWLLAGVALLWFSATLE
jgi:zinc and cadmium transporter